MPDLLKNCIYWNGKLLVSYLQREKNCVLFGAWKKCQNIVRHMFIFFQCGQLKENCGIFYSYCTLSDFVILYKTLQYLMLPWYTEENCRKYNDLTNKYFNIYLFLTLETEPLCLNMHCTCGVNTSTVVEDIRNIIKSSFTSSIFVSLSCGHGTNDTNSSEG